MSPFPTFPITGGNPKLIITRATRLTVLGHFHTAILQYCTGRALDIEAIMADDTLLSRLKLPSNLVLEFSYAATILVASLSLLIRLKLASIFGENTK